MINKKSHWLVENINFNEFKRRYENDIIISYTLKKLKAEVETIIVDKSTVVVLPKYKESKDLVTGRPIWFNPEKSKNYIIRLPAVNIFNAYLVLDGCHRLLKLKPKVIILDALKIKQKQYKYIEDLRNVYWASYISVKGQHKYFY